MRRFEIAIACALAFTLVQPASAQQADVAQLMAAMDANSDGAVSFEEAQAARRSLFTLFDLDHNGTINEAERRVGRSSDRVTRNADTNGDGRISRSEFMDRPYTLFNRVDANHDHVASAEEIAAAQERMRGRSLAPH